MYIKINSIKNILICSFPLVLFQLCELGLGVIDTVMISAYDVKLLPAVNISASYYIFVVVIIAGFSFPFSSFIGQYIGAKRRLNLHRVAIISIWISLIVALIGFGVIYAGIEISKNLGYEKNLYENIKTYLTYRWIDVFFISFAINFRFFLQNHGMHKQLMFIGLLMLPINVLFNYLFIYGFGNIPELGIKGAAIATALTNFVSVLFLIFIYLYVFKIHNYKNLQKIKINKKMFLTVITMGFYSAIALIAEGGIVASTSIVAGKLDQIYVIVHSIFIVFLNVFFAYTFGFSQFINTKVAILAGEGNLKELKIFAAQGLLVGLSIILIFLGLTYGFKHSLINIFVSNNIDILKISDELILFFMACVVFQYVQVFSGGFMRALNLHQFVLINYVVGVGFVGFPVLLGALFTPYPLIVIWLGIITAFFLVTILNIVFIIKLIKENILLNKVI